MSFMTNQIIRRNKKEIIYIYIYIYILINYEYFNNLNKDRDMAGTGIMVRICISPYLIEKVRDSLPIPSQCGDFPLKRGRVPTIPTERVYLSSLMIASYNSK